MVGCCVGVLLWTSFVVPLVGVDSPEVGGGHHEIRVNPKVEE